MPRRVCTRSNSACSVVLEFFAASRTATSGSASTTGMESGVTIDSGCASGYEMIRRSAASARSRPSLASSTAARAQQRELALEQIILTDLSDLEATAVQHVE